VFAGLRVQALGFQAQAVYRLSRKDVGLDDFVHVGFGNVAVPDGVGVNDYVRAVFALIEATGLVGSDSALQSVAGQLLLEPFLQTGLGGRIAAAAGMACRPLVSADKDMVLEFGHQAKVASSWNPFPIPTPAFELPSKSTKQPCTSTSGIAALKIGGGAMQFSLVADRLGVGIAAMIFFAGSIEVKELFHGRIRGEKQFPSYLSQEASTTKATEDHEGNRKFGMGVIRRGPLWFQVCALLCGGFAR